MFHPLPINLRSRGNLLTQKLDRHSSQHQQRARPHRHRHRRSRRSCFRKIGQLLPRSFSDIQRPAILQKIQSKNSILSLLFTLRQIPTTKEIKLPSPHTTNGIHPPTSFLRPTEFIPLPITEAIHHSTSRFPIRSRSDQNILTHHSGYPFGNRLRQ